MPFVTSEFTALYGVTRWGRDRGVLYTAQEDYIYCCSCSGGNFTRTRQHPGGPVVKFYLEPDWRTGVSSTILVEVLLYVHRNRRIIRDGEPRTSSSTFTQPLSSVHHHHLRRIYCPRRVVVILKLGPFFCFSLRRMHQNLFDNSNETEIRGWRKHTRSSLITETHQTFLDNSNAPEVLWRLKFT